MSPCGATKLAWFSRLSCVLPSAMASGGALAWRRPQVYIYLETAAGQTKCESALCTALFKSGGMGTA
eukprot:764867-Hanusia_phi.AAC.6